MRERRTRWRAISSTRASTSSASATPSCRRGRRASASSSRPRTRESTSSGRSMRSRASASVTDFSRPNTRGAVRAGAIARLNAARIETAVLDADLLLAFALGIRKEDVYAHPERDVPPEGARRFAALVERRARGEPVAYLRGVKEFYGLDFTVDPRVLIPRP